MPSTSTYPHHPLIQTACHNRSIPGCVLVASSASGDFSYTQAFGHTASGRPVQPDSLMWTASCTKLLTTIAALQLVERGRIGLDEDVGGVLPEVAALRVLTGFDGEGQPVFKERGNKVTLRLMLTHASGLAYAIFDERLQRAHAALGTSWSRGKSVAEDCSEPLVFEPGEGWNYSTGIDWAGKLVERLSGQTLEVYMRENLWTPLGIRDMTFFPDRDEQGRGWAERRLDMSLRAEDGGLVHTTEGYSYLGSEECFGGGGVWSTAVEYVKVLRSLCGNDEMLLGRAIVDEMFRPQLNEVGKVELNKLRYSERFAETFGCGYVAKEQEFDYGLGGLIGMKDERGWRKKGTLAWGGVANLIWFVDRETGLCGAYFSQYLPPGNPRVNELDRSFEKAIYEKYEEFKKGL